MLFISPEINAKLKLHKVFHNFNMYIPDEKIVNKGETIANLLDINTDWIRM